MKILFDHQIFGMQKYGGISRYITSLYKGINKRPNSTAKIGLLYSDNFYANQILPSSKQGWKQKLFKDRINRTNRWNDRYDVATLPFTDFDILHPTYYDTFLAEKTKKPVVITVHDMIHEKFPGYFPDADLIIAKKQKMFQRADRIIAISQSTYDDLINIAGIDKNKVQIVHHGIETTEDDLAITPKNLHPDSNYVLFVGERWLYKNFTVFIARLAELLRADKQTHLVCVGGRPFTLDELALFKTLNIGDQCFQYTVTDAELRALYKHAICFLFPSLYEGFGLPILEAFSSDCPVVLSNTSSFKEVGGNAALYFPPDSCDEMVDQIRLVMNDKKMRNELILAGREQVKQFAMEKCVDETMKIYNSLL